MITAANHSFNLIAKSKECVINIPEKFLIDKIVGIGNTSGSDTNKFEQFELTALPSEEVKAPLIKECFANFECKLIDTKMLDKYNFFILEVVKAHVAASPKYPNTVHYRGDGIFMVSGENISRKRNFRPEML